LVSLLLFVLLAEFRKLKGTGSEAMRTEGQEKVGLPLPLPPPSIVQKDIRHGKLPPPSTECRQSSKSNLIMV
jgi:hypothetical protein